MAKEIERKFLVEGTGYRALASSVLHIVQGYLSTDIDSTVRIRIVDDSAYLTVKSRNKGAVRNEWEYKIPVEDARQMLDFCNPQGIVVKDRYIVGRWEIDEFHGRHENLVIAEIELTGEDEKFDKPPFIGLEVTGDPRYYNSVLSQS